MDSLHLILPVCPLDPQINYPKTKRELCFLTFKNYYMSVLCSHLLNVFHSTWNKVIYSFFDLEAATRPTSAYFCLTLYPTTLLLLSHKQVVFQNLHGNTRLRNFGMCPLPFFPSCTECASLSYARGEIRCLIQMRSNNSYLN